VKSRVFETCVVDEDVRRFSGMALVEIYLLTRHISPRVLRPNHISRLAAQGRSFDRP
jgi:hypothetical protein